MGTPLPRSLSEAPILEDAYQTNILAAFWKLSTCRNIGMGTGPIPWTAIDTFAVRHGYDADEIEYSTFVYLITEMDSTFLKYVQDENEKEGRRGKSRSVRGSAPAHRIRRR
jgi:hypothetical protein